MGRDHSYRRDTPVAMTREDIQVVIRYYQAADLAAAAELLAGDVAFWFHGETRHLAGAERISGKSAAVGWLADWFSRFDSNYAVEVTETRDLGDRVLVVTRHRATGRASGVPIDQTTGQIMTLRDGQIVRQDFYGTPEEAIEAVARATSDPDGSTGSGR